MIPLSVGRGVAERHFAGQLDAAWSHYANPWLAYCLLAPPLLRQKKRPRAKLSTCWSGPHKPTQQKPWKTAPDEHERKNCNTYCTAVHSALPWCGGAPECLQC